MATEYAKSAREQYTFSSVSLVFHELSQLAVEAFNPNDAISV